MRSIGAFRFVLILASCDPTPIAVVSPSPVVSSAGSGSPTTGTHVRTVARASVVEGVRALSGIVRRVDRIDAKRVLVAQLPPADRHGLGPGDREVWVVAVAGEIWPAFAADRRMRWGTFFDDALTGSALGSQAGDAEAWPPFFDALVDRDERPGFLLGAPCGVVAGPAKEGPQTVWSIDCGMEPNRDARRTIGAMLEAQQWRSCGSGLAAASWRRDELVIGVSEGSGVPPNYIRLAQRTASPSECP